MTVAWPSQLPDYLEDWQEQDEPLALWTNISGGSPKVRANGTTPVSALSVTMRMKAELYTILRDFFRISLSNGTKDFVFPHPYQGSTQRWWMAAPPEIISDGPIGLLVGMKWLQLDFSVQSAPLSFTCTVIEGNQQLTANWTESYFADSYQVWVDDAPYSAVLPNTARTLVISGLTNGQDYDVRVVASNAVDDISSNEVNATPSTPVAPGEFAFSAIAGHLKATISLAKAVSWTAPDPLPKAYRIKWGTAPATYTSHQDSGVAAPTATITGLGATATYYWRVYGVDYPEEGETGTETETAITTEQSFVAGAANATYYELRVGASLPGTLVTTIELNGFPYADDNLTEGVERNYWLVANGQAGGTTNASNNPQPATPVNVLPGTFTYSVEAGVQSARIILTSTSVRATSYEIRQGAAEPGTLVAEITEGSFPYVDSGLTNGVERKYWLLAKNAEGTTASSSNPRMVTPTGDPAPEVPEFALVGLNGAVQVNLTTTARYAADYVIKQGNVEGSAVEVAAIAESAFPYVHTGQTNGVTVKYWLYARNASGTTAAGTNGKTVTPQNELTPPGAFSFALTPGDNAVSVALSPASTGADYYNIWTGTWGAADWTQRGGNIAPGSFPYNITGTYVANGTPLRVFLSAFNAGGSTQATGNPKTATPTAGTPGPFSFTATPGEQKVTLALVTQAAGATSYKVKRDTVQIATGLTSGQFPWDDTAMSYNVSHSYEVLATNANGDTNASNSPQSAKPWSTGVQYPANTISWDAADASKMTKFSGTQALDKWESKDSATIFFDGNTSSDSCVHTAGTNSVDASVSPERILIASGVDIAPPYTGCALLWFPSDCPAQGHVIGLSSGTRILFAKSGAQDNVRFQNSSVGLFIQCGAGTGSVFDNEWVLVTWKVAANKRDATLRINGTEFTGTDSATADIANINALRFNDATGGVADTPVNTKVKRLAIVGQDLTGTALTDFESAVLNGEGGGSPPPPEEQTTITKAHDDTHIWEDPREAWSTLGASNFETWTTGALTDPSQLSDPGVLASQDGVALFTRGAAPQDATGSAYLHRLRKTNSVIEDEFGTGTAETWRSGVEAVASGMRLTHGVAYIEVIGFYFDANMLGTDQKEVRLYSHRSPDAAPNMTQPEFGFYLIPGATPTLEIRNRYSIDGLQASSVGNVMYSMTVAANTWYYFAHQFLKSTNLALAPYNRIWTATNNGTVSQVVNSSLRNCSGSSTGYSIAHGEARQTTPWGTATVRHCYSTGMHVFKDRGGQPAITQLTLIGLMRDITKPSESNPVVPDLDPWTDPRATMVFDANKLFSAHTASGNRKALEIISGFSGVAVIDRVHNVPSTGLQVDTSSRRTLTRVTGVPGMSAGQWWFSAQIDETIPKYNAKTIRISIGRADYAAEITNDGVAHWYAWDLVLTDSMYKDLNHKANGAPMEISIHGLHHVAWNANAGTTLLTPFSGYVVNRSDRTGMNFFYRVRSNTTVTNSSGTATDQQHTLTWNTPAANYNTVSTQRDLYLTDAQGANIVLVSGQHHKFVARFRLGWQKSNNPILEYWHQVNQSAWRKIATWTGPVGHRLADMSHQLRCGGLPYNWYVEFNEALSWNRSANGVILAGNHGMRTFVRSGLHVFDTASSGKPTITPQLLFDWLNRA